MVIRKNIELDGLRAGSKRSGRISLAKKLSDDGFGNPC